MSLVLTSKVCYHLTMLAWVHIAILEEPSREKHYIVHETNETIDSLNVVFDKVLCDSYRVN